MISVKSQLKKQKNKLLVLKLIQNCSGIIALIAVIISIVRETEFPFWLSWTVVGLLVLISILQRRFKLEETHNLLVVISVVSMVVSLVLLYLITLPPLAKIA
jgi:hypothetical protein